MNVKILFIGDIVGKPGRSLLARQLKTVVRDHQIDCVIANAENAAGGSGLTPQIYEKLGHYGVDLITLGDHAYRKREIIPVLESQNNIAVPGNLSEHTAGRGVARVLCAKGITIGVVALIGRLFMKPADCPYTAADRIISRLKSEVDIIVVDFHAEATSEKIAMGYHLDGRVSCCFGTHTHIPTADEHILPNGTAYITDVGMTGSHHSVLGRKIENVLKSFRTQMPVPFEIATEDVRADTCLVTVDSHSARAIHIERFSIADNGDEEQIDSLAYDADDGRPDHLNHQM